MSIILCIDDEPSILIALKDQIQNEVENVEIELAQNAYDALEIIEELKKENINLDLIISDYLMPEMNGDEFLIKAHLLSPNTKNIMLTGQAELESVTRVINEAKLYRYISKPWEKNDLILTVKEALESTEIEKNLDYYTKYLEKLVEDRHLENLTYLEIIDKYLIASKTDVNGIITEVSQAMCDITGYTKDELINQNHSIIRHPDMKADIFRDMWMTIKRGKVWEGELKNLKKDGGYYWVKARISPTFDKNKNIIGFASIRIDITDKVKVEVLSITDELTGLYNRRYFLDTFKNEYFRAQRENKNLSFVLLDIDYFKPYNDTYGHLKGDEALRKVSTTIKYQLNRASDHSFRLGGEEFGIMIYDISVSELEFLILKVKNAIRKLNIEHKNSYNNVLTVSFGGVVFNCLEKINIEKIYKSADNLLYQVKENGRDNILIKSI